MRTVTSRQTRLTALPDDNMAPFLLIRYFPSVVLPMMYSLPPMSFLPCDGKVTQGRSVWSPSKHTLHRIIPLHKPATSISHCAASKLS